jgi:hypothetical protein
VRIPNQFGGVNRASCQADFSRIIASLSFGPIGTTGPSCTCIRHGDSKLWECCKFGTDDCRACVGETTNQCCKNLIDGRPSPVPLPVIFAV